MLAALAVVTLFALTVRLWGIDRLLPHRFEPDAFLVYQLQAFRGDPGRATLLDYEQRYPTLLPQIARVLPSAGDPSQWRGSTLEQHLARASLPFLEMRVLIALLSVALVPLTFFVARRALGDVRAFLGAAFVATSLLHLQFSGQARPHGAATSIQFSALLCAMHAIERKTWRSVLVASAVSGLALGSLQTGAMLAPALAVSAWLSGAGWKERIARTFVALATFGFVALPFYPFLPILDEHGLTLSSHGGHPLMWSDLTLVGITRCIRDLREYDPVLTIGAAVGAAVAITRALRLLPRLAGAQQAVGWRVLLLCHALPYVLVLGLNGNVYERFTLPIVPYLALASADAVVTLAELVAGRSVAARRGLTTVLAAAALAWPALTDVRFGALARQPDNDERAARWIVEHAAPADRILNGPAFTLPLLRDARELDEQFPRGSLCGIPWLAYQRALPRSELEHAWSIAQYPQTRPGVPMLRDLSELDAARAVVDAAHVRWIVLEHSRRTLSIDWYARLRDVARERGELVFVAQPSADPNDRGPHPYQGSGGLSLRLAELEAFGPPIEVYELRR